MYSLRPSTEYRTSLPIRICGTVPAFVRVNNVRSGPTDERQHPRHMAGLTRALRPRVSARGGFRCGRGRAGPLVSWKMLTGAPAPRCSKRPTPLSSEMTKFAGDDDPQFPQYSAGSPYFAQSGSPDCVFSLIDTGDRFLHSVP
jgi:hypothetical protein